LMLIFHMELSYLYINNINFFIIMYMLLQIFIKLKNTENNIIQLPTIV